MKHQAYYYSESQIKKNVNISRTVDIYIVGLQQWWH